MKWIYIVITTLMVVGCGKKSTKDSSSTTGGRDTTSTTTPAVTAKDIVLRASRDYRPNDWTQDEVISPVTARYDMPEKLTLIVGNAGRAWASVYVGRRKFCYKGNAPWITLDIGTEFNLKYEKLDVNSPCSSSDESMEYETTIVIAQGDTVRLEFDGGRCGIHCHYTEVEALIKARQ